MGRRSLKPGSGGAEGSTLAKDKIVEEIAHTMSKGEWLPYRSVRQLAVTHGLSLENAQKYCAEAGRLLRLSWGGEEAKMAVVERIAQIGRAAETRTEETVDAKGNVVEIRKPDHRTALTAAKHLADILGLSGANSEVVIRYQQMSDSDLAREASRFLAQLSGESSNGRSYETSGEEIESGGGHASASGAEDEGDLSRLVATAQPRR